MAFLDNLGKKLSEASQGAIAKTKDFADVAKLNASISEEEKRMKNAYAEIGKAYVEKHADDFDAEYKDNIDIIKEATEKIADYQVQIKNIKGVEKCQACGAEVAKDVAFCPICGAEIVKEAKVEPAAKVCPNCGEAVADGAAFCAKCGTKIEEA